MDLEKDVRETETLNAEIEQLKEERDELLLMLKDCHDTVFSQIDAITSVRKELRRYEVQLNSLKAENEEWKRKFAKIEKNFFGKILLKLYRFLREIKRRIG